MGVRPEFRNGFRIVMAQGQGISPEPATQLFHYFLVILYHTNFHIVIYFFIIISSFKRQGFSGDELLQA